jgi:hypothetical protein
LEDREEFVGFKCAFKFRRVGNHGLTLRQERGDVMSELACVGALQPLSCSRQLLDGRTARLLTKGNKWLQARGG